MLAPPLTADLKVPPYALSTEHSALSTVHVLASIPNTGMHRLTWTRATTVFIAFIGLALLQAWPLPLHLGTHLTGQPSGDTGVYVWNTWVFRHEMFDHGGWPLWTREIFVGGPPANLGHHNYTLFANLLAVPLQSFFSVVTSFNLIYLLNIALAGFTMFLLARRVTTRDAEAWMAGALFACSGFLVGRSTGHFSLVAAAPLPLFAWCVLRCWERRRTRDALALGLSAAWAITADPYYAVYCVMIAAGFLVSRVVSFSPAVSRGSRWRRAATVCAALAGAVVVANLVTGGGARQVGPLAISVRSLYTPMLVLTAALAARALMAIRVHWSPDAWPTWRTASTLSGVALLAGMFAASPVLASYALGDSMDAPPIFWRTGPQGADLLALLLPHWQHPLIPDAVRGWLASHPGGLIEQSASLSIVALLVIAGVIWRTTWRPTARSAVAAVGFSLLSMGPFIYVAGINTYIPTPWAFLRYVPIIEEARMPGRMAIVATMAVAVVFAGALNAWTRRVPRRRGWILVGVAALLWIDLMPAPTPLFAANIPAIYTRVAADPRPISVLDLPTGVRDGLSSLGDFSAHSQFFQIVHGKRIVGGYLSRTTPQRRGSYMSDPVLGPLMDFSEGRPVSRERWELARAAAPAFVQNIQLGYVVINHRRTSAELSRFAMEVLQLAAVESDADQSLYVPFGRR